MLTIRDAQMRALASSAKDRFAVGLAARLAQRCPPPAPDHERVLGMIDRAIRLGFTDKAQIAAWAELECLHGDGFADRPENAGLRNILAQDLDPNTAIHKIRRRLQAMRGIE